MALVLLVDGDAAARLAYAHAFGQLQIAILASGRRDRNAITPRPFGAWRARGRPLAWRGPSTRKDLPLTVLQAIILGLTQGVTEFAPISSSGHLILVPWLFNWSS